MKESQPGKFHELVFHSSTSAAAVPSRLRDLFHQRRFLILTILVGSLTAVAAQTEPSRTTAIHDHLRKAEDYLKAKDPNAAATEFNAVLALDPKNAEAYANIGVIEFLQGHYQNASQNFRKALAIDPSLAKTQALLGISLRRLGDPSARALLEKSFPMLKDKQLSVRVGLELTTLYDQQGEPERAVAVMEKLVDLNPDDQDILYTAQRLYREIADDTLDKLAVLAPGSARMQQVIAERLINAGDAEGAVEHYKKALEIDPRLPGVHFELAQTILQSARNSPSVQDQAEKELETAMTLDGDSANLQCALGAIAMLRADLEKAYAHYTRALAMDPGSTQAQVALGRILMTMEKPQEARRYLEMAVKADPLNETAHYRLAVAYKRLQMPEQAQKEARLFKEIKETKDHVRDLYQQMKSQYREDAGEISGDEEK
jgi:tetratricopeptide (TPR) repeat protein